jgi:hypothetical protein
MSKIWMVHYGGYSGRKYYKTEAAFMEAINKHHTKATVTIFEEVEQHNALEYKNNLITQREREEQLQIILEDNQEVAVLHQIKEIINTLDTEKNYTIRGILRKFSSRGMNAKTFKNMLTDRDVRKFMLYTGPSTKEWYKLLLQIHNFKMDEKYYDYRSGAKYKEVEKERLDNFKLAKEELKREKKDGKKEENTSI